MSARKNQSQVPPPQVDLETLGTECQQLAAKLKEHLSSNGHQQPSFEFSGPTSYPKLSPEIDGARQRLREACKTLLELASEPDEVLTEDLYNKVHDLNAFAYVSRFKIPEAIPIQGSIKYSELASKTGTGIGQLKRALRHLMTLHVFVEPELGSVAHTASSKRLVESRGVRLYNDFVSRDTFKLAAFQVDAIDRWGHDSGEPDQAAHNIVYGTDNPLFDYYGENPARMAEFSELMQFMASSRFQKADHLVEAFDWAALGSATLVDMGGNVGHCAAQVALANPDMSCVVQDLPEVVARALSDDNSAVPAELRGRVTFMEHSIFAPQPLDAEVYLLRMILHDWSDDKCVTILGHIAVAMGRRPGSRLLVMDTVLPQPGEWQTVVERPMRSMDMQMSLMTNSKERDFSEFESLFRRADPRLVIRNVFKPVGSLMSLIEVTLGSDAGL
ncbi:hypothetical protein MCOR25_010480 [Pyricularia grisea]|uniref:O-methyltransferase C-terminal domain-containing protein n=1 Tax=Pyricularia grisea TaxID=148305 RepID=A0A6P8B666_PYRGI|nr:hypothetical protein PgNI_05174 [Pyricularia grisea]KAI6350678.1 hypothetical protein MCOR25_010480 [Pyricularia grisea]TLD10841.1 hypothetical protein PgNI_05174 [Pyricularia grisea]